MISVLCAVLGGMGCSEIEARRTIQKADKLYQDGKYAEAIELYEEALAKADLATGHHNLAIAAFNAFQPGVDTPSNMAYADKASKHFQAYLAKGAKNEAEIVELLTTVWVDSDKIDEALAYWTKELEKDPNSLKVLGKLSSIQRMAGNYDEALKWDYKRVELAKDDKEKVLALVGIGQLQYSRLTKPSMVDEKRIAVADSGIAALKQAMALQPDNPQLHSLTATLYQFRSLGNQTSWARLIDVSSQRHHHIRRKEIVDAAKAQSGGAQSGGAKPGGDAAKNKEKPGAPGQTSDDKKDETKE